MISNYRVWATRPFFVVISLVCFEDAIGGTMVPFSIIYSTIIYLYEKTLNLLIRTWITDDIGRKQLVNSIRRFFSSQNLVSLETDSIHLRQSWRLIFPQFDWIFDGSNRRNAWLLQSWRQSKSYWFWSSKTMMISRDGLGLILFKIGSKMRPSELCLLFGPSFV